MYLANSIQAGCEFGADCPKDFSSEEVHLDPFNVHLRVIGAIITVRKCVWQDSPDRWRGRDRRCFGAHHEPATLFSTTGLCLVYASFRVVAWA